MDIVELQFTPEFIHSVATHLITCVVMWALVVSAAFIDLWDRVYTQNKLKKPLTSHLMRKTLGKIGEYWRFLLIALIIDVVIFTSCSLLGVKTFPICTSVVSAASDRDAKKVIQYVADYIGEEKNVNQKIEE